jgi:D-beta-D-heptose 7-phosphate kinase/D-beta-D-heptose 1-phosphate adenosyltransferase
MDNLSVDGLSSLVAKFQGRRLLVIGDLIVSRFVEVSARKLAREAPVPAGDYVGETRLPGGAANLSRELTSLGANVTVLGVVGDDAQGAWLREDLSRNGINTNGIVVDKNRPTSLRTWIMVNRLHYLRIDQETRTDVPPVTTRGFADSAKVEVPKVDAVVLSDYDRGVMSPALIDDVVSEAREAKKITVAQPKNRHYLDFSGVTYIKSNLEEATHATGMAMVNETSLRNMGVNLMQRLDCRGMLITRGEQGMTVFEKDAITNFPPIYGRRNFFSKVGVRDTMTGVFALGVAAGGSITEAACLSNIAGPLRSDKARNVSLTVSDFQSGFDAVGDFLQRISQAPVRR